MKRKMIFRMLQAVSLGTVLSITHTLFASLYLQIDQDTKTLLFRDAKQVMEQAQSGKADVYSPTQYETALKYYERAEEDYDKGRSLEDIRDRLKMAEVYFARAVETTKLFKSNFPDCINARDDALAAGALEQRAEEWMEAETVLEDAAKTLEKGNLKGAGTKAKNAESLYRKVELEAVKANVLDETRLILNKNEKDLKKSAPLTLARAYELLNQAEALLSQNRYDTDEARQVALEAKYEAQHAIYLAEHIDQLRETNKTLESILLDSEKPVRKIADDMDLNARFHEGFDPPLGAIIEKINQLRSEISTLKQDLNDSKEQVAALNDQLVRKESQLGQMESQLGEVKSREASLSQLMEQQRLAREKFTQVENMFAPEEAQVLRIGDQVIIRLYGLTFPVGQATIEPQYYGLLTKVLRATEEYPGYEITIEGHTDSWGSDKTNQELSTQRAMAVREYFMATAGIDANRITAVGYGESKPIASNETSEGRKKNRRIDAIIHTKK